MMYYKSKSISERLIQAEEAIDLAQSDAELNTVFVSVGYTEAKFAEGLERFNAAMNAETNEQLRLGEQVAATARMNDGLRTLRRRYAADRKIIRSVLQDNRGLYEQLRLHINIKSVREAFIMQATYFYEEVVSNVEVQAALASSYNMAPDTFEESKRALADAKEAMKVQQLLIGQARVATRIRQEAMAALDEWMTEFIRTARYAFKNNERQLKKLGLIVAG